MTQFGKDDNGVFRVSGIEGLDIGTAARAVNHIDYSLEDDLVRREEKSLIHKITNIPKKNIPLLKQAHRDGIFVIDEPPEENLTYIAEADGIITNINELCLVIRTADCVPVYAFDRKNKILGAAHSGWRGCRLAISTKLIREMKRIFHSSYNDIFIFILPSIGSNSYTVNNDVASFFDGNTITKDNKIYLDLWGNIESLLKEEGMQKDNIFNANICSLQNKDEFFSHRNGDLARNINWGFIK